MARRHGELLNGGLVADSGLRELQEEYRAADGSAARRRVALEFERAVRELPDASLLERVRAMSYPEFTETFLRDPKGHRVGQPFTLEPHQRVFDAEFGRRDRDGRREYSVGILGVPRGCGKTADAAARSLYELLSREHMPEVFFAAGSKDQARIAFQFAEAFVRGSEPLRDVVEIQKDRLLVAETGGVMTVLPAQGATAFGLAPTVAVVDELWTWRKDAQHELWDALLTATQKAPDAFLLALSTAPQEPGSLLGELLEQELSKPAADKQGDALTIVRDVDAGTLTMWYGAPQGADLDDEELWRRCNPSAFKDMRGMRKLRRQMQSSPAKFARLHLNALDVEPEDALISRELWDACRGDLQIPGGADVYCAAEAAFDNSALALAWVWRHPDRRVVCRAKVWSTSEATAAHEQLDALDPALLERELASLAGRYELKGLGVGAGPALLGPLQRRTDIAMSAVYAGSSEATEANRRLFALVQGELVAHEGDPVLSAHVLGVRGTWDSHERLNVYRLRQDRRVDSFYALAVAVSLLPDPDASPSSWFDAWGGEQRDNVGGVLRQLGLV